MVVTLSDATQVFHRRNPAGLEYFRSAGGLEAIRPEPLRVSAQIESGRAAKAARFASTGNALLKLEQRLCQSLTMDKGSVIETLRRHEPELKAAGIVHLRLFGSVARGEESPQSDVDLMADFDRSKCLTLFDMATYSERKWIFLPSDR
jgi:hypothetical protein